VTLSPRAALFIAPTLIVTAGAIVLSREATVSPVAPDHVSTGGPSNMLEPMFLENDVARLTYQKQTVALDLLCGRCTLDQAADAFYQLTLPVAESLDRLRTMWPGRTDHERSIVQVLSYSRMLTRREHERFGEPMTRIESEAKALLGTSAPLH
jgi:hypothetical protein